jgi:SAM-dependent methyltransferase
VNETPVQRVRLLYEGDLGRRWRRIEDERPASYFEQNIVVGRRKLRDRLMELMPEAAGRRILDAGCGLGKVASRLAEAGAQVTAVDLVPGFIEAARDRSPRTGPTFVVGDFADYLGDQGKDAPFDTLVLTEVLEDYEPTERYELLRRIAASTVPWFYLAFRTVGDEGGIFWERLSDSDTPGIREIDLLRWIHLGTPFRQTRQVKVHVRNYRVHVSEFKRDG